MGRAPLAHPVLSSSVDILNVSSFNSSTSRSITVSSSDLENLYILSNVAIDILILAQDTLDIVVSNLIRLKESSVVLEFEHPIQIVLFIDRFEIFVPLYNLIIKSN